MKETAHHGGRVECYLLGKHCIQNARGAKEKLRACFSMWKVWVSPKLGVKGCYVHQLQPFKLRCLS